MKVLLVGKWSGVEPLGLCYLGAALKRSGHQYSVYFIDDSTHAQFKTLEAIQACNPDIVGFSTYTGEQKTVYSLCDALKLLGVKTAIGGPHTLFFADECREHADYVFKGEAMVSFPALDDSKVYSLLDVKDMPHPDREELYRVSPIHKASRIKNIMCSFGCSYSCSYCLSGSTYRNLYPDFKVRLRSVDDVILEARTVDAGLIFFQDDCFGFNLSWLEEFSRRWDGRPYHCQLRFELATYERLNLLKQSGCTGITAAIESANENTRRNLLNRQVSDDIIFENAEQIQKFGIKLRTEQMLGLPETIIEDDLKLLEWNNRIKPTIAWTSIFQPYRGTELGEYCIKKGYYSGDNGDVGTNFFDSSPLNFSQERKEQLSKLQRIFAVCSHLPNGAELAREIIMNGKTIEGEIKNHLYRTLYA